MKVRYIHLPPESKLSDLKCKSCRIILVVEEKVSPEWQDLVCRWIVDSGCLYLMTWGENCEDWHDKVDSVNIRKFKDGDVPDDCFIMTTWHDKEEMEEVFWFSKNCAFHPTAKLRDTLIVHISKENRENELVPTWENK